jgi:hypothetical protein
MIFTSHRAQQATEADFLILKQLASLQKKINL